MGNLIEKKGHKYVLKSIARLVKKFPNLYYIIIGDGKEHKCLLNLSKELKIEKHVAFLG